MRVVQAAMGYVHYERSFRSIWVLASGGRRSCRGWGRVCHNTNLPHDKDVRDSSFIRQLSKRETTKSNRSTEMFPSYEPPNDVCRFGVRLCILGA